MGASFTEHFEFGGTAQVAVGVAETAPAAGKCKAVKVKANLGNTDNVYVGKAGVLTTTGYELDAGEETPWIPVADLSDVALIGGAASQGVSLIYVT